MAYKKSEQRKQQILDCAKHLFAQKGYQAAQISDICEELKIARGTVYQYFENKENIFTTLIEQYFENMNKALPETPVQSAFERGEMPDLTQIQNMLTDYTHAFLLHMYRDRDLGRIIFLEGFTALPGIKDKLFEFFEDRKQRTVAGLRLGVALGVLRPMNADLIASAMMGTTTRVILDFILEGRVTSEDELRPMAEELVAFQLRGVIAR